MPHPTSNTGAGASAVPPDRASQILRAMFRSTRKCWPKAFFRPDFTHSAIVLRNPAAHRAPPHGKGNYFDAIICGDGTFLLILEPVTPFIVMAYDIFISYRRDGGKGVGATAQIGTGTARLPRLSDFDELKDGVFDRRIMEAIDAAPILHGHPLAPCPRPLRERRRLGAARNRIRLGARPPLHPHRPRPLVHRVSARYSRHAESGLGQHQFSQG